MNSRSGRVRRFTPRLEALDGRWCPSVSIQCNGPDLRIEGDDRANAITITDDGQGRVTVTADGRTVTCAGVSRIEARTRGGNDTVDYTLTGSVTAEHRVRIDLEAGNDTANLRADGVNLAARAEFEVNGGTGSDRLAADFAVEVDGQLRLRLDGQDGNDTVTANLALAAGSTGAVEEAKVSGGAGDDNLTLNVTGTAGSMSNLRLDGGAGFDRCAHTPNVEERECEAGL